MIDQLHNVMSLRNRELKSKFNDFYKEIKTLFHLVHILLVNYIRTLCVLYFKVSTIFLNVIKQNYSTNSSELLYFSQKNPTNHPKINYMYDYGHIPQYTIYPSMSTLLVNKKIQTEEKIHILNLFNDTLCTIHEHLGSSPVYEWDLCCSSF